jgi:hypothetical protein
VDIIADQQAGGNRRMARLTIFSDLLEAAKEADSSDSLKQPLLFWVSVSYSPLNK